MCGFEVENDQVREVCSVFVLAAENEKLVSFVQGCRMAYASTSSQLPFMYERVREDGD